eukprot:CAMPEP_0182583980 /NCGR_PEP_ID=MMETSP1324-20130603/56662_1 /TAXON_ID=236786 /ORGANISM="Florenciella sp., Strain RCC1587" /LENGTH=68 /DNA_ID=CAMNT_0024800593 /DNA_START=86 /DNA_END=289 /DNA_ORIENTATION=+
MVFRWTLFLFTAIRDINLLSASSEPPPPSPPSPSPSPAPSSIVAMLGAMLASSRVRLSNDVIAVSTLE